MVYQADKGRYDAMKYFRCGGSGLKLPALSLGLWHNFGGFDAFEKGRELIRGAFDAGITHFDLANIYGPPVGSAEEFFGRMLKSDLAPYRDELLISTKASDVMFEGPYGSGGSRKTITAALDSSLKRLGVDYVDIFYMHAFDDATPLEETMAALDFAVRQGKALYIGISNHDREQTAEAIAILNRLGTPLLIHQTLYNMFDRRPEQGLLDVLESNRVGCIAFCPLAQGLLTERYLNGIPEGSRATGDRFDPGWINRRGIDKAIRLRDLAAERGQTLPQMALAWIVRGGRVTSALIGASRVDQIRENAAAVNNLAFSDEELQRIDRILAE